MNYQITNRIIKKTTHRVSLFGAFMFVVSGLMLLSFTLTHTTSAAPSYTMNYQGKLTTAANVAVPNGTYNMRFWLLTTPTIGTTSALWTETLTGTNRVQVTNGLFSVMLGSTSPLTSVDFNQTLYLGVEIGSTTGSAVWDGEMSPRKILGTVPSAFEAKKLNGLNSTQFVRTDATSSIATTSADTMLTITQNGAGDLLKLLSGTTNVFSVLNSGYVGVGSSSPNSVLTVVGTSTTGNVPNAITAIGGASTGGNGIGGGFSFLAGDGYGTGIGGSFAVTAGRGGSSGGSAPGGGITLTSGRGGGGSGGHGGTISISGAEYYGLGGSVSIVGGTSENGYSGGNVFLDGGVGSCCGAPAGNVLLTSIRGNVGIGTSSPIAKFSVAGNSYFGGNLTATGTVTFTNTTSGILVANSTGVLSASTTIGTGYLDTAVLLSSEIDTSSELAALLGDEVGTAGYLVFNASPNFTGAAQFADMDVSGTATTSNLVATSTLRLLGGTSFPTNPSEGTLFYSSASTSLYVYEQGKWQADRSTASFIVAASDSQNKEKADYVSTGTNDQDTIEQALAALPSTGGLVYLLPGTYNINNEINITQASTTLMGAGPSTLLKITATSTSWDVIDVANTSYVTIKDLAIDGGLASAGNQDGIAFNTVSTSTIDGVIVQKMRRRGISLTSSDGNMVIGNNSNKNTDSGMYIFTSNNNNIAQNTADNNSQQGIYVLWYSVNNSLNGNHAA